MTACRPRDHLAAAGRRFPGAWRGADVFRAGRGVDLPEWPQWCFLPMAAAYAIVSGGGANRVRLDQAAEVGRLAALMAWRVTQGIYRFDTALFERIIETPIDGDLPHDVLFRLPEWCVYVETPGMQHRAGALHGFFAHLEWDVGSGRTELRLLLDADTGLEPVMLHLGPWSLAESIRRAVDTASGIAQASGMPGLPGGVGVAIRPTVEPLLSLLLYLCSENAEIGDGTTRPANPTPKRTKQGLRLFQAERPSTWDVGVRLGSALRRAYHAAETAGDGTHEGPRPHIRRAHWHGFRSGPMKRADGSTVPTGERAFALRWLPPIAVNLDNADDLPATVRPVRD